MNSSTPKGVRATITPNKDMEKDLAKVATSIVNGLKEEGRTPLQSRIIITNALAIVKLWDDEDRRERTVELDDSHE